MGARRTDSPRTLKITKGRKKAEGKDGGKETEGKRTRKKGERRETGRKRKWRRNGKKREEKENLREKRKGKEGKERKKWKERRINTVLIEIQGVQECSIPKCKVLRIFITIKTIEFGIWIYLSDMVVLLAFWRILNQRNRPNKTENTWHYVKRVIFCILIEVGKRRFYELFSLIHGMLFLFICGCVLCLFWVKTYLKSYNHLNHWRTVQRKWDQEPSLEEHQMLQKPNWRLHP